MQAAVLQARQAAQEMQAHLGGRPVTEVTDVKEALQVRICRSDGKGKCMKSSEPH